MDSAKEKTEVYKMLGLKTITVMDDGLNPVSVTAIHRKKEQKHNQRIVAAVSAILTLVTGLARVFSCNQVKEMYSEFNHHPLPKAVDFDIKEKPLLTPYPVPEILQKPSGISLGTPPIMNNPYTNEEDNVISAFSSCR